ncbi:hypothetical protein C8A01DRAFT_39305 [Parachaetomium inaequale]|uniref:Uncharacterized protein n=1 Tax=Parachaetomium inaequale TaxID=2588326 RepID=A0AAN6SMU5_9PEZI|nr:hypothetical protein C8A01DRAFT_39305 [Parachaetomium inaequale]
MPLQTETPATSNMLPEETPFPIQHSRSSSTESASTDYDAATADKDAKFPDIVRRDMEFFMARLSRTTSNDSTASTTSTMSR